MAVRLLLNDLNSAYRILGFIDDDPRKRQVRLHGYRVLGGHDELRDMIMSGGLDAVVVTHASGDRRSLESLCARYGVVLYRFGFDWLEVAGSGKETASAVRVPVVHVTDQPPHPTAAIDQSGLRHAFSVDVEDWFHGIPVTNAMKGEATPRLERGLQVLLDLLGEHQARATFFILGPLVGRHANILRRIASEGHELGCHGWSHELVYHMNRARFAEDAARARAAISDLTGCPVDVFRAPYFSITRESLWAFEVLAELGFKYDSSVFPVRNWRYGIADFSRDPVLVETAAGCLWEFPISVIERYGQTIPVSGGAYFRLYPYSLTRANFRIQEERGRPVVFYVHPWELDPDHPHVPFAWKPRFTHYANLQSTRPKLVRLLREFRFGAIGDVIASRV
jgi:polysaccharide deacetylase family protein (PEP-CTERM system associated)